MFVYFGAQLGGLDRSETTLIEYDQGTHLMGVPSVYRVAFLRGLPLSTLLHWPCLVRALPKTRNKTRTDK